MLEALRHSTRRGLTMLTQEDRTVEHCSVNPGFDEEMPDKFLVVFLGRNLRKNKKLEQEIDRQ